jgi:hypothetical protein
VCSLITGCPQLLCGAVSCLHSLQPSTKTRLRYYKRYVSAKVQQQGVSLAGAFRRTDRDEDVDHFVRLAQQYCAPDSPSSSSSSSSSSLEQPVVVSCVSGVEQACANLDKQVVAAAAAGHNLPANRDAVWQQPGWGSTWGKGSDPGRLEAAAADAKVLAYQQLVHEGVGMFTSGLSHTEFRALDCKP